MNRVTALFVGALAALCLTANVAQAQPQMQRGIKDAVAAVNGVKLHYMIARPG